ncbi:MAG TPA: hemolysin D [Bacteroides sp.]|nr:hemolysin D [Bacteroides sp.]
MTSDAHRFSASEERANAISHFSALVLACGGLVLMIVFSAIRGTAWHVVSTSVFGATMIILYTSSTFNHWLKPGKSKEWFFNFDQVAIFLLIAGTYTPLTLVLIRGGLGWTIFGIEWGLAIIGITIRILNPSRFESGVNYFFIALYVIMGWMLLIGIGPLARAISPIGLAWILIGGGCYTLGILFYKKIIFPYHHLVWHLFVIAGSIFHFFAIFFHVIPDS